MKSGLTQDENGEFLDASKVETALKSVGVALRDAQGQFRDLDQVILELGAKWSTLDSATKRYLGTVIAGNRQQSRFLALMENYDRLVEIQNAAMDSEDAGVLQYAKTLDSLESKLNQISNSFQQFYMSILNGPVIGEFLTFLNSMITGFSKLGNFSAIFNIASIIRGVKTLASLILQAFSPLGSQIITSIKQGMTADMANVTAPFRKQLQDTVSTANDLGYQAGTAYRTGFQAGVQGQGQQANLIGLPAGNNIVEGAAAPNNKRHISSKLNLGLTLGGAALSAAGTALAGSGEAVWGSALSMMGSATSGTSMLSAFGAPGMIVGGLLGALSQLPALIKAIGNRAQEEVDKLKTAAEKANIKRAEDKNSYKTLVEYANKIDELTAKRYESNEAYQEWLDLNNEIVEAYPELLSYIDSEGNAITGLTSSYAGLETAKRKAAESNSKYYSSQLLALKAERALVGNTRFYDSSAEKSAYSTIWTRGNQRGVSDIGGGGTSLAFTDLFSLSADELQKFGVSSTETKNLDNRLRNAASPWVWALTLSGNKNSEFLQKLLSNNVTGNDFAEGLASLDISVYDLQNSLLTRKNNGQTSISKAGWQDAGINSVIDWIAQWAVSAELLKEKTGEINDSHNAESVFKLAESLQEIQANAQGFLSSQLQIYSVSSESYKSLQQANLQDLDKIVNLYAAEKARQQSPEADIVDAYSTYASNLSQEQFDALTDEIEDFFYSASYATRQAFSELLSYNNYGSYSDYQKNVNAIISEENQTLRDALIHGYSESMYQASNSFITSIIQAYNGGNFSASIWDKEKQRILTYSEWKKQAGNEDKTEEDYLQEIDTLWEPLSEISNIPVQVLEQLSIETKNTVGIAIQKANTLKKTGTLSQQTAASSFLESIQQITKLDSFQSATAAEQNSILSALTADQDENWLKNAYKALEEAGITLTDELKQTLADSVYIAFNTIVENAKSKMSEVSSAITSAAGNQGKGLTVEEAQKEFKALGLEGKLSDWYHWEDSLGGLVMSSEKLDEAMNQAEETSVSKLKELKTDYDKANTVLNKIISDHSQVFFSNTYSVEQWAKFLGIEGSELAKGMQDYVSTQQAGGRTTDVPTLIQEYFDSLSDQFDDATIKFYEQQIEYSKNQAKFALVANQVSVRKSKYSGPSNISDKDWFTANGYTGDYTEQSLAQFAQLRGYVYDSFTGEFTETIQSIELALASTSDPAIRRALYAQLDSAKQSLAETIADYTGSVTQEQINYLKSQGIKDSILKQIADNGAWNDETIKLLTDNIDATAADYIKQAYATRKDSRLTSIKSTASSMLSDAAGASLDDIIGLVKDVFDNPDLVLDDASLATLQDVQKQGIPGIISLLESLNGINGADFTAEISSYKEQYVSTAKSSVEKILTALASGEEVLVNDVAEVWEQLTGTTADEGIRKTIADAMKNGWQGIAGLLQSAVDQSNVAPDFANQLREILNSVIDTIREGVQSSISDLSSGISGSLSRAGVASLAKQSGVSEDKILSNAKQTLQGYQLSQQGALDAAVGISQQSNGLYDVDIAKTLYDAYKGTDGILGDYTALTNKIAEIEAGWASANDEVKAQYGLLKQLQSQYQNAADNYDFLNPDYYDGVNDKFDNFLGTAKKMGDTFQSISDSEKVAYTDAMTFVNVLNKADDGNFAKALEANGMKLEDFRDALNQTMDTSGNVDLAGMFSKIGLSMEMAGQDLEKGIQSFAEKRIEQLEGMKKFLESQKAIAEALKEIKFEMPQWDDPHSEEIITNQLALMDEMVQKAIPDFKEKIGQSYSSVLMSAIGLTPEQVAGFNQKQFEVFTKLANDLNQQWATVIENADWDVNNPDQYLQNFMQMLRTWAQSPEVQQQLATVDIPIHTQLDLNRNQLDKDIAEFNENKAPEEQITIDTQYLNQDEIGEVNKLLNDTGASAQTVADKVNEIGNKAQAATESSQTLEERLKELTTQVDELTKNSHTVVISANTNPALLALQQVQRVLSALAKGTIIPITTQQIKMPVGGNDKSPNFSMVSKATGNVNGLAMYQGTQLAGKTLVGELGPELAVYDNAYHILGENGAEFVNIPDNAIIFNHKQTEGIINGQAGVRGKTKNGGPAFATGTDAAIAAIDKEISLWKSLLKWTTKDLVGGGGGGGGSGNTIKAHIEDLVEWYNLTRQIVDIEQKINNIIAERENITDGHEYLRSLREQQHLLEGQAIVQRTLLNYQQKQVELQAKQINTNSIWSKFFTVGEDGLLQYIMGNEENGGKGTLSMLQQLNQMSGEQQLSYIKGLGYSYTDNDGNALEGEELVAKFYEEAQDQIDKYDELRDTVEETDETLSKLQSSINEIEEEIHQNQLKLEQAIYDSIVSAWEKQISQLTEQMNLLKEANDAYVNGLSDALNKEKNLYNQNQSTSEREQLQRQLSLLRRAGGSASQIASLEEQLDSSLKNEYFSHQQESIDSIKEANEKQIDALNKQIQIQQETLDFQKENGVLWTKVYEILSRSDSEILEFLVGNNSDFFTKSAEAQKDQLNDEWAKSIGIYKENNDVGYIGNRNTAADNFATEAWNSAKGTEKKKQFEAVSKDSQELLKDYFASAYANAKLKGMDDKEAYDTAREDMYKKLYSTYTEQIGAIGGSTGTTDGQTGGNGGSGNGGSDNNGKNGKTHSTVSITVSAGKGGGRPTLASSGGATSAKVAAGSRVVIAPNPFPGYVFDYITYNGTKKSSMSITTTGKVASIDIKVYYKSNNPEKSGGQGGKDAVRSAVSAATGTLVDQNNQPALLHKGEGVFTAKQTSALIKMVDNFQQLATGNVGASLLASLLSTTKNYSNLKNDSQQVSAVNVNPGAVVIQVEQLNDKYDIDSVATDVFNKITSIASKATSRGVNRR